MIRILYWLLSVYEFLLIIVTVKSFAIYFMRNHNLTKIFYKLQFLDTLTDPYLNIFRKLFKTSIGRLGLDFSPIIGIVIIDLLQNILIKRMI